MQSIQLAIAFVPVAVYLLLIGGLRLRSRPLVTTGWRDTLALGIAASGLVAIGPMQLFFPAQAAARWQGWVWIALMALYLLGLFMILLSCKPRLISYGMDEDQFRRALQVAAKTVDDSAHWNGEILNLPQAGIQLASDPTGTPRVHQVVHFGLLRNLKDWIKLEGEFVAEAKRQTCPRSIAGIPFVLAGIFLLLVAIAPTVNDPETAYTQLQEFINR